MGEGVALLYYVLFCVECFLGVPRIGMSENKSCDNE